MSTLAPHSPSTVQIAKVFFHSPTANAWGASFLRHLNAELVKLSLENHQLFMQRVVKSAQAKFDAHIPALPDVPSRTVLGMCALILSAYRELLNQLGSTTRAFELVEQAFDRAYQSFIQNICKPLLLNQHYSPLDLARMNFKTWGERMYKPAGASARGAIEIALGAELSGYHHFLLTQGEPGLAQMIRAADQAWAEVLAASSHPLNVERRSARTHGTGFYPFRFAPNARKRSPAKPGAVLELQTGVAPVRGEADRRRALCARSDSRTWDLRNLADRRSRARS